MTTPATVLETLATHDPSRPRLTWYHEGAGERIELSGGVLSNWVAKAANVLQEEFDIGPAMVVAVDLPILHWRASYWVLAAWAVGATISLDAHEGADVLVTTSPESDLADDSDEVIAVTLPALARNWGGPDLPSGVFDEAAELANFADSFHPWQEIPAETVALTRDGERWTVAEVVPDVGHPGDRVYVSGRNPIWVVRTLAGVWGADGSVVIDHGDLQAHPGKQVRGQTEQPSHQPANHLDRLLATERVTAQLLEGG